MALVVAVGLLVPLVPLTMDAQMVMMVPGFGQASRSPGTIRAAGQSNDSLFSLFSIAQLHCTGKFLRSQFTLCYYSIASSIFAALLIAP